MRHDQASLRTPTYARTRDASAERLGGYLAPAPGAGASEGACVASARRIAAGPQASPGGAKRRAAESRRSRVKPHYESRARRGARPLEVPRFTDGGGVRREHCRLGGAFERAQRLRQLRLAEESLLRIARRDAMSDDVAEHLREAVRLPETRSDALLASHCTMTRSEASAVDERCTSVDRIAARSDRAGYGDRDRASAICARSVAPAPTTLTRKALQWLASFDLDARGVGRMRVMLVGLLRFIPASEEIPLPSNRSGRDGSRGRRRSTQCSGLGMRRGGHGWAFLRRHAAAAYAAATPPPPPTAPPPPLYAAAVVVRLTLRRRRHTAADATATNAARRRRTPHARTAEPPRQRDLSRERLPRLPPGDRVTTLHSLTTARCPPTRWAETCCITTCRNLSRPRGLPLHRGERDSRRRVPTSRYAMGLAS